MQYEVKAGDKYGRVREWHVIANGEVVGVTTTKADANKMARRLMAGTLTLTPGRTLYWH